MTMTSPSPHVYRRIAEDVGKRFDVSLDPHQIELILERDPAALIETPARIVTAVQLEAHDYGLGGIE